MAPRDVGLLKMAPGFPGAIFRMFVSMLDCVKIRYQNSLF